jgi:hypothetical protein
MSKSKKSTVSKASTIHALPHGSPERTQAIEALFTTILARKNSDKLETAPKP